MLTVVWKVHKVYANLFGQVNARWTVRRREPDKRHRAPEKYFKRALVPQALLELREFEVQEL